MSTEATALPAEPERFVTRLAYSPTQAADALSLSRATVYDLIASGQLPARKIGGRCIVTHEDLVKFLAELPTRMEANGVAAR